MEIRILKFSLLSLALSLWLLLGSRQIHADEDFLDLEKMAASQDETERPVDKPTASVPEVLPEIAPNAVSAPPSPPRKRVPVSPALEAALKKREESIYRKLKDFIKKLDGASRKGITFPTKLIETALRTEFFWRTEGNSGISWLRKRSIEGLDKSVAQDNLSLLITFANTLTELAERDGAGKNRGKKRGDDVEWKLLAAKAIIDGHNEWYGKGQRWMVSSSQLSELSAVGRGELNRRRRLLSNLAVGDEFEAIPVRHIDDYGAKFKNALQLSVREYEKLAAEINQSAE